MRSPGLTTYRRLNDGLNIDVDPVTTFAQVARVGSIDAEKTYQHIDLEVHARMGCGLYPDDEVSDAIV